MHAYTLYTYTRFRNDHTLACVRVQITLSYHALTQKMHTPTHTKIKTYQPNDDTEGGMYLMYRVMQRL